MIYLLRIHTIWYCPVGTGTLPKLPAEAKEKRETYPGLYLTINCPSPTRTAAGHAWPEAWETQVPEVWPLKQSAEHMKEKKCLSLQMTNTPVLSHLILMQQHCSMLLDMKAEQATLFFLTTCSGILYTLN